MLPPRSNVGEGFAQMLDTPLFSGVGGYTNVDKKLRTFSVSFASGTDGGPVDRTPPPGLPQRSARV
jgi:hypothetical protein